jgi:hypothetical protein
MICDLSYYEDNVADDKAYTTLEKAKEAREVRFGKGVGDDECPIIEVEVV